MSVEEVENLLLDGNPLPPITRKPDKTFGNALYKSLREKTNLTPFLLEEFKKLPISEVELMCCKFDELDIQLIKSQSIVKFAVNDVNEETCNRRYYDTGTQVFDMHSLLLTDTLKSYRTLRHLDFRGVQVQWLSDFLSKIDGKLHRVQFLGVTHQKLNNDDMYSLFANFPNLTFLDISFSDVPTLRGIDELKKLKTLILAASMATTNDNDLMDLFESPKLEHLDLSTTPDKPSPIMHTFVNAGFVSVGRLPKLTSLYCNHCDFPEEALNMLLDLYPTIEMMGLEGTKASRLQRVATLPDGPVYDAQLAISSLESQLAQRKALVTDRCLAMAVGFIDNPDLIRSTLHLLCTTIRTFNYDVKVQESALNCLVKLDTVHFEVAEAQMILRILFFTWDRSNAVLEEVKWKYLVDKYQSFCLSVENVNWMALKAKNTLIAAWQNNNTYGYCLQFILKTMQSEHLTRTSFKVILENRFLLNAIFTHEYLATNEDHNYIFIDQDTKNEYDLHMMKLHYPTVYDMLIRLTLFPDICEELLCYPGKTDYFLQLLGNRHLGTEVRWRVLTVLKNITCVSMKTRHENRMCEGMMVQLMLDFSKDMLPTSIEATYSLSTYLAAVLLSCSRKNDEVEYLTDLSQQLIATLRGADSRRLKAYLVAQNIEFMKEIPMDTKISGLVYWQLVTLNLLRKKDFDVKDRVGRLLEAQVGINGDADLIQKTRVLLTMC